MAELIAAQNLAVLAKDCCGGQTLVATQQGKRRRAHAPPIAILAAPAADHRRDVRRELDRKVTQLPSYVAGMVGGWLRCRAGSFGAHHVVPAVRRTLAARMSMPMSIVADELCALILKAQTDARMDAGADAVSACARSCQPQGGIDPRSKRRACLLTRRFLPDLRPLPKTSESCQLLT